MNNEIRIYNIQAGSVIMHTTFTKRAARKLLNLCERLAKHSKYYTPNLFTIKSALSDMADKNEINEYTCFNFVVSTNGANCHFSELFTDLEMKSKFLRDGCWLKPTIIKVKVKLKDIYSFLGDRYATEYRICEMPFDNRRKPANPEYLNLTGKINNYNMTINYEGGSGCCYSELLTDNELQKLSSSKYPPKTIKVTVRTKDIFVFGYAHYASKFSCRSYEQKKSI